jgi:hypothetical protein
VGERQELDSLTEDAGLIRVGRIDVADTEDPTQVDSFVTKFLRRLAVL